jgi:lipopolysaccharide export system permease protein
VNLLDRYIFRSVLLTCLGSVALFAFVLMLGNAIRDLLGYLLRGQLSLQTTGELILLLLPFVVSYALPMGILTGVLLVLGRISADSEVTAMRANGISLLRVARPVLFLGLLGCAATLYVNFESMPWARVEYDRRLTEYVRADPARFIVPKTFIRDFPGYVVYVGEKQGTVLRDFWLWQLDGEGRALHMIHAESGRIEYDKEANAFIVTLTRASVEDRRKEAPGDMREPPNIPTFEKTDPPIVLSLDRILGRPTIRQKLQWMTYAELQAELGKRELKAVTPGAEQEQKARDVMQVRLVIQDKLTTAFAVLSFALIGVPLGVRVSRRETTAGLGIATLLALGYYFLTVMVGWLSRHPEYRPDLLYWVPNLIFLALAVRLFRRLEQQ